MAVTELSEGSFSDGSGNTCSFTVDYDSTGETIGTTITTVGTSTQMVLSVTITATSTTYSLDCLNGPGGNITDKGRVVLAGSGSVLGKTTPIPPGSFPLPPFARGTIPPYVISAAWHQ